MKKDKAVAVARLDPAPADLRDAAAQTSDAQALPRMLAFALVLEGWSRDAAAEACPIERQKLRDWVHRFNASALDGLHNQAPRFGPPPRLSEAPQATVAAGVAEGPEFERDGMRRWRWLHLQRRIRQEIGVTLRAYGGQADVPSALGASTASANHA